MKDEYAAKLINVLEKLWVQMWFIYCVLCALTVATCTSGCGSGTTMPTVTGEGPTPEQVMYLYTYFEAEFDMETGVPPMDLTYSGCPEELFEGAIGCTFVKDNLLNEPMHYAVYAPMCTVLMHELTHVFLGETTGHPDKHHQDPIWQWTVENASRVCFHIGYTPGPGNLFRRSAFTQEDT